MGKYKNYKIEIYIFSVPNYRLQTNVSLNILYLKILRKSDDDLLSIQSPQFKICSDKNL